MSENQPTIYAAAPQTINHIIGQRRAVELLRTGLAAFYFDKSAGRNPEFGHVLMTGGPGLGKTLMAQVLAKELAAPFKECLGQTFGVGEDVYQVLLGMPDDGVLFIDEAHLLLPEIQTILFRALEERKVFIPRSPLSSKHMAVPLSRFSFVLASTDEFRLLSPLRDRMKLILRFDYYSTNELAELVTQRANALKWDVEASVFMQIAERSKGTPRLAIRLLESCYRTARAEGSDAITSQHMRRTCEMEGIGEAGLDQVEQKYLQLLAQSPNKPVRLNVISSVLGLPHQTISRVTEQFLLRAGLIVRCDSGRALTERGIEYIESHT